MQNEFLSVLYDMDYHFTNHTLILEKLLNNGFSQFLNLYWFQTFTSFTFIFVLYYLINIQQRLDLLEKYFLKHLDYYVEDSEEFEKLKKNVKKLSKKLKKNKEKKYCKAIANLHFEKRRGLIQCENLAEEGSDFCKIHDERDILPSSEEENDSDSDYVYESADENEEFN